MKWVLGHGDGLKPVMRAIGQDKRDSVSPALLAQRMRRLRLKLKSYLEKEGVVL